MAGEYYVATTGMGNRIRERREAVGMSANELAIQSGITPATLSRIELDASVPKTDTLLSLAGALHVSLQEIQPPSLDNYNSVPSAILPAFRKFQSKSPAEQAKLAKMFEAMIDLM